MFLRWILVVVCITWTTVKGASIIAATEKDLRRHLFEGQDYDKRVRPVKDPNNAVHSSVAINPLILREVDDQHHTMTLDSWLTVVWHDDYLKWTPSEFGGIEHLNLPLSEVWSPDLSVYTGISDSNFLPSVKTNVVIRYDGEMIWVPPFSIHNRCPGFSPTESHHECTISIVSWTYDITQLDLEVDRRANESLTYFEDTHPTWKLTSMEAAREVKPFNCCPEPFPIVNFVVTLEKH